MPLRRGFSLIELLVVMVVIAALAAIVLPRLARSKERAVTAMLMADLRYLATLQEIYWNDHGTYSASPQDLGFAGSDGVVVALSATAQGWTASADHGGTPETCAYFIGTITPRPPAVGAGAPECAELP